MKVKHGCNINSGELDTSRYSSPMPAIGLYIAGASLTCLLLATIDTITGCKAFGKKPRQKFWFPCKWFGINSATLTLLSVATKLPVDLNTAMPGPHHQLTKLSGTVMLSVATAFFLPALGTMNIEDKLSNLAALIILIITVAVNICIQMGTGVIFAFLPEHIIVLGFMLFMLVSVFTATISSERVKDELKESSDEVLGELDSVLKELKERKANSAREIEEGVRLGKEGLQRCLYVKHTAYTEEIEYAIIRSPNGSAVAFLSILSTLVLVEAEVRALVMWLMARGRRGSGGMQLFGLHFCRGESDYRWPMWFILASQTLFVILTTIPLLFRWFESVRFVRHPIKEMLEWPHLLIVELHRLSLSMRKILEFFLEEEAGRGGEGHQTCPHISIGSLLHSTKLFFVSLQLLGSAMSWIISRSSSAPLCLLFWSLKRLGNPQEGKMPDHMVVHLKDEKDFGDWMYTHYKSVVDEEMGKTNDPSTTSPPHGNDSDGNHLKKILSKFDSTTDQIIENEDDSFRSLINMIDNQQRKCMEIVLGMVTIANKLAQVEVDRSEGYTCLWNVKPNQNLNGPPPHDVKIVEQFLQYINQHGPGKPTAFSGIPASSEMDHSQKFTTIELWKRQLSMQDPEDDRRPREKFDLFLMETLISAEKKLHDQELQLEQVGDYIQSKYLTQVARVIVHTLNHLFPAASSAISSIKDGTDEVKIREVSRSTFSTLCLLEPLFPKLEGRNHSDSALSKGSSPTGRPPHRRSNKASFTCLCASFPQVHEFFRGELDA